MTEKNCKYDLVVFGATGFTGQFVVEEVAKAVNREKEKGFADIEWAIAGRNKSKLEECLSFAQRETGLDLYNVGLIIVNVLDETSIGNMTKDTKVIINCVGPYHLYGKPIVESCIQNGTNQVDITGEPQYMNELKILFDEEAKKAGVHIVNACGWDSVPADVGLCHLTKIFPGRLNSARGFVKGTGEITTLHTGTMESLAIAISQLGELTAQQAKLYPTELPKPQYPKRRYLGLHKSSELSLWGLPFPSDEVMVHRSQRYLAENTDLPYVQYQGFMGNRSVLFLIGFAFAILYFYLISICSFTRNMLMKYPRLMTAGIFSKKGPSRKKLLKSGFKMTLLGEGWSQQLADKHEQYSHPPDHKLILEISGPDPGYRGTSIMMVACAMTLLKEKEKCSERGGVVSPGMTFINTNIIDRLIEGGIFINVKTA